MARLAGQSQKVPAQQSLPVNTVEAAQALITGGRLAQYTPQDSNTLFRSIADSVPTMIWMTGLDMGVTFLNKVWFDYTGLSVEQAMGQGWVNAFHPDDRARIAQTYSVAFQRREPVTFEARKTYHGAEYRWVMANGVPYFDASGTFSGYIGTCLDITDRKQADEEARLLHTLILAIEEVDDVDTALNIVLKEICQTTGWIFAQVWMPNLSSDRLELRKPWYGKNNEVLERFRNRNRNYTFHPNEGLPGQVWFSKEPVWVENFSQDSSYPRLKLARDAHLTSSLGVPVLANSTTMPGTKDVVAVLEFFRTEFVKEDTYIIRLVSSVALQLGLFIQKKIMEQNARESEARFQIMADCTPAIIWVTDVNDQVVYLNKQWVDYTGRSVDEVKGATWWESVHPDDIETCYQTCRAAKERRADFHLEFRLKRTDGVYRWMLDTAAPRFDAEGRYLGYVGSMLDITDRKMAEDQLKESEERFRTMAEAASMMIWTFDEKTDTLTYANQNLLDFFELSRDVLPHLQLSTFLKQYIHPDDIEVFTTTRTEALQKGIGYKLECRFRYKNRNDDFRWILASVSPRFIANNMFSGFVGSAIDITDRKMAEDQLKESEERFRAMAEASAVMIWVFDASKNALTYGNQTALEFLGITLEELNRMDMPCVLKRFIHPDDLGGYQRKRVAAMKAATGYEHECRVRYHNSEYEYRWVLLCIGARLKRNKEFQGFVGTMVDITERKQTEQALKESETLFKTMADTVPALIWMVGADMKVGFHNRAYLDYTGLKLDQIQGLNILDIIKSSPFGTIYPDDIKAYAERYLDAFEKRQPFTYEIRLKHYSGEYRWMIFSGRPRFDNVGNFAGYIGSYMDIHEIKESQIKLAESESRFRNMADTAPFMIIMSDLEEGKCHFNQAWQDFTGIHKDTVQGHYWFTMEIHPDDRRFCLEKYRTAVQTHQTGNFEYRMRRHDGEYRWVLASAAPRYGDNKKLIGFIGSCIEITEIRQYRTELERTVAQRTQELETVNKELEAFSYSVSHDLRAPLRGIDGISQLVYKNYQDLLDDQGKNYLQILRQEAQRMSELINEMLNLSRLTRGTMHWEKVNFSQMAEEIAASLEKQEPNRNVTFNIQKDIIAYGDTHLLRAVLENLIGNSWKFTSKHATALIQFGVMEQDNQRVYYVKDDGAGFEMEYADNLFGAFQRLHDATEFPGTGIGLATVQRIIHRHGGKVWAHGEVEKGAELFFTLGEHHD